VCVCVCVLLCLNPRVSRVTHAYVWWCVAEGGDVCEERNRGGNELRGLRRTHGQLLRHLPLLCVRHRHYVRVSVCCSVLQSAAVCCGVMHASDTLLSCSTSTTLQRMFFGVCCSVVRCHACVTSLSLKCANGNVRARECVAIWLHCHESLTSFCLACASGITCQRVRARERSGREKDTSNVHEIRVSHTHVHV